MNLQGKGDVILPLAVLGLVMFITSGWPAILHNTIWGLTNLNATTTSSTGGAPSTSRAGGATGSLQSNPNLPVVDAAGNVISRPGAPS